MSNVIEFGSLHGRLCGELAAALAEGKKKSQGFYPDNYSASENQVRALASFGLLSHVPRDDRPGETWHCWHELAMDAAEIPDHLARTVSDGDQRLPVLLAAFLGLFVDHTGELSDRHAPFSSPDHLMPAMSMLVRTGYASKVGKQFRWTQKITPAMQAAWIWDENGASFEQTADIELERNAQLAWQTMPKPIKMALLSDKIGFMQFVKILALGWKEGRWVSYRLDDPFELQGEITLARRILELAASGK